MIEFEGTDLETLQQDEELILARHPRERALVLIPVSPTPQAATQLEHFYSFRDELDPAWALQPTTLHYHQGSPILVIQDPGGEPLATLLHEPLEMRLFFRIAISIASALGSLHARGLIHRDIKPASILVNAHTGEAWLGGLGRASRVRRQRQAPEPPQVIVGTLAYMAPEQTGRMNRSIDSRSDLYALGVVLYQMLVGELPFLARDPMELVHCHVARRPIPPHERVLAIPERVSGIVMKLLAKLAEERYQTAAGVEADLRYCFSEWEEHGRVDHLTLGAQDSSDQFLIQEKLYGRERNVSELLSAFDEVVASGRPGLMLISGYSGVGKSSVVNELHKALLPPHGIFASGKFDQYNRDIPYDTLAQAFRRLLDMILVEPEAELARYRSEIALAITPYGQLVVNLVPQLERVIGKQPPAPELAPEDAQRVLEQVLRRFIGVFARAEHPLALFLDDLQWFDAATLNLVQHLLLHDEVKYLFLVGAYRDNEVGPEHPLAGRLEAIRKAGARVSEIQLGPLGLADVGAMVSDALHDERVSPLTELVYDKTAGNPFFTIQFLTALADDELIAFDRERRRWTWDGPRIAARRFTDNVVALMIERITRLPAVCREAMQVTAGIGNTSRVDTLAAALDVGENAVHTALASAVHAGLVAHQGGSYAFLHDRIQEAAYSFIPPQERPKVHLRVGRNLLAHTMPDQLDEAVFEIVSQLNRGVELVTDRDELDKIAELNLRAGKRAKAAAAYVTALAFLKTGAAIFGADGWSRNRALSFGLAFEQGECEFLTGEFERADARLAELVAHAKDVAEDAMIATLRVLLHVTRGDPSRSVEVCLEYLARIGIHFSLQPSLEDTEAEHRRLLQALGDRSVEDLRHLPECTDVVTIGTLDVIMAASSAAWYLHPLMPALLGMRMVTLSIENGNSPISCYGYVMLGMKLGPYTNDYRLGCRFGELGLALAERNATPRTLARVSYSHKAFVKVWVDGIVGYRTAIARALQQAKDCGDVTYAAYIQCSLATLMLIDGSPLHEIEAVCRALLEDVRKINFEFIAFMARGQLCLTRMLRGDSPRFGSLDNTDFNEQEFERTYPNLPGLALPLCWHWIRRQHALVLAGDFDGAAAAADAAEPLNWVTEAFSEFVEHHFYAALARADCLGRAEEATKPRLRAALDSNLRRLEIFAANSPQTWGSRASLAAAEVARLEGREREAMDAYERAIRAARSEKFIHIEALAFELAARFYDLHGFELVAAVYRREARACYVRWGADGKVRQLEHLHPDLRERGAPVGTTTINAPVEQLDLATVLKVSQAVSSEIQLSKLLDVLMRTAIEHAGATRGLLILPHDDGLRVEAEAFISNDAVVVRSREGVDLGVDLPESIARYAMRMQSSVILDDTALENPFASDRYLEKYPARSLACLPLINQSNVSGVLYLENQLAPQTFTSTRVAVLKLLASQAAISLENTRLYANLEEREARIRRLVDANVIGIFIWNLDGTISDANDAFLSMLDYGRDDLTAGRLRWSELTAPEWRVRVREAVAEVEAAGTLRPFELEYLRRDGSRVPVLIGAATFEGSSEDGVAFVLDLSGLKRTERQLRRSEYYLAEAQHLTHTGSWSYDVARNELGHCSEEFARLFGVEAGAARPSLESFREGVHVEDRVRAVRTMLKAVRAGRDFEIQFRTISPGSMVKYIQCLGHPVLDSSGTLVEYVGTVMDVSERLRADQERERLRQAQADLAHVTRVTTMGELTASLAHEIKQPLAAALLSAKTCLRWLNRDEPNLERGLSAANRTGEEVKRAADIVARVGSLFKKDALPLESVDLSELIREMIVILRGEASRFAVSIRTELDPDLPRVLVDRIQIQQVLLNLFMNAIDAMKELERPRELLVSSLAGSQEVVVSVQDTGTGLPPQSGERIFEAFFTTKREGTGMGLSISRSIIESHGGRLSARNNPELGATLQFTLPFAVAAANEAVAIVARTSST